MLSDLATGGPTREAATDVFLRELPKIAEHGAVLILDDFHLVDESPDVRIIARELVARAPERLSIVFASRQTPPIPFARMRAAGEVAEIGTDDLRFDAAETARLFSETYGRDLEPDVLADVTARTEGWAASLQLVQAALRDRSPAEIRRFVRGLTGADQELYDYLAEEVVGDLPDDLQQFLMRTSILQVVTPELAAVVAGLDEADTAGVHQCRRAPDPPGQTRRVPNAGRSATTPWCASSSRHGCAQRSAPRQSRSSTGARRTRPRRPTGASPRTTTGRPATLPPSQPRSRRRSPRSWAVASTRRGRRDRPDPEREPAPGPELARVARSNCSNANYRAGNGTFRRDTVEAVKPGSQESDYALLNLMTLHLQAGLAERSQSLAARLQETHHNDQLRLIAEGTALLLGAGQSGSHRSVVDASAVDGARAARRTPPLLRRDDAEPRGQSQSCRTTRDQPSSSSNEAIEALEGTSSRMELSAALVARAVALTLLGQSDEAQCDSRARLDSRRDRNRPRACGPC